MRLANAVENGYFLQLLSPLKESKGDSKSIESRQLIRC